MDESTPCAFCLSPYCENKQTNAVACCRGCNGTETYYDCCDCPVENFRNSNWKCDCSYGCSNPRKKCRNCDKPYVEDDEDDSIPKEVKSFDESSTSGDKNEIKANKPARKCSKKKEKTCAFCLSSTCETKQARGSLCCGCGDSNTYFECCNTRVLVYRKENFVCGCPCPIKICRSCEENKKEKELKQSRRKKPSVDRSEYKNFQFTLEDERRTEENTNAPLENTFVETPAPAVAVYKPILPPKIKSIPQKLTDNGFCFGLRYERTEWGNFFLQYKTKSQIQLFQQLRKQELQREIRGILVKEGSSQTARKIETYVKKLFRFTELGQDGLCRRNPEIFDNDMIAYMNYDMNPGALLNRVLRMYHKRCFEEYEEVITFYRTQEEGKKIEQKEHRLNHAKETVICPFCNAEVKRTNVARHKKNNKECLSIQEKAKEEAQKAQQEST